MSDTYAGQGKENLKQNTSASLEKIFKMWAAVPWAPNVEGEPRRKEISDEIAEKLLDSARNGSWMAANMLHLSGISVDFEINGEKYEYQPAKKLSSRAANIAILDLDTDPYIQQIIEDGDLHLMPRGLDIDPSIIAESGRQPESFK